MHCSRLPIPAMMTAACVISRDLTQVTRSHATEVTTLSESAGAQSVQSQRHEDDVTERHTCVLKTEDNIEQQRNELKIATEAHMGLADAVLQKARQRLERRSRPSKVYQARDDTMKR